MIKVKRKKKFKYVLKKILFLFSDDLCFFFVFRKNSFLVMIVGAYNSFLNFLNKRGKVHCKVCSSRIGDINQEHFVTITNFHIGRVAPLRYVGVCDDAGGPDDSHGHNYIVIVGDHSVNTRALRPTYSSRKKGNLTSDLCREFRRR